MEEPEGGLPGAVGSYAPILVPIVLISAQSVSRLFLDEDHFIRAGLAYVGWPVMALSIGVWLAYRNIRTPEHPQSRHERLGGGWTQGVCDDPGGHGAGRLP